MKNRIISISIIGINLWFSVGFAVDTGKIQSTIVSPLTPLAGNEIDFQVTVSNSGKETWLANDYYFFVEIYDNENNFVGQSKQYRGTIELARGDSADISVPYKIGYTWGGKYFYRFILFYNEERVLESTLYPFNIIPLPDSGIATKFGGSLTFSYRYSGTQNILNLNLNLGGKLLHQPCNFNAYTYYTPEKKLDFYTVSFSYSTPQTTFFVGDSRPNFSTVMLSDKTVRGIWLDQKIGPTRSSVVIGQTNYMLPGSSTTNGTFDRYLLGGKEEINFGDYATGKIMLLTQFDSSASLSDDYLATFYRGPGLTPIKNDLVGVGMTLFWQEYINLDSELVYSSYWQDYEKKSNDKNNGLAVNTKLRLKSPVIFDTHRIQLETGFQETAPKFYSLSSPYTSKDRRNISVLANYSWDRFLAFNIGYTWSKDNPNNDSVRVSIIQGISNFGVRFLSLWQNIPDFNFNYSKNQNRFLSGSSGENYSETYNFVFNHKQDLFSRMVNFNLGLQDTRFQATGFSMISLFTRTLNFGAGSSIDPTTLLNLAISIGYNRNETLLVNGYSNSVSLVVTKKMLDNRLTNQVWTSWFNHSDGYTDSNFNLNFESVYDLYKNLSAGLGYGFTNISGRNNRQEHSINLRVRQSF